LYSFGYVLNALPQNGNPIQGCCLSKYFFIGSISTSPIPYNQRIFPSNEQMDIFFVN